MQKNLLMLALSLFLFAACNDDDTTHMDGTQYHIHLLSPDESNKKVGDEITVSIEVEEHSGETVHHVSIRLYNKATGAELFTAPAMNHVHETDGKYEFSETVLLDVEPHSDMVLEVKAWGHDAGVAEATETLEFHVHPM